jgi:hypothetical protein
MSTSQQATWIGTMVVDRDGTELGTCADVLTDDHTGIPRWAAVELDRGTAWVPAVDAVALPGQLRVSASQADVATAPLVAEGRPSQEEEVGLYRHYGLKPGNSGRWRRRLIIIAGLVAGVVTAGGGLRTGRPVAGRLRQARRARQARARRLRARQARARRIRAAGELLPARWAFVAAAPWMARSGSASGGRRARARTGSGPDVVVVSKSTEQIQKKRRPVMNKVAAVLALGIGYVLVSRAGRKRYGQLRQSVAQVAQRPHVQQARERASVVNEKLREGTGQLTASAKQRAIGVRAKRSSGAANANAVTDAYTDPDADEGAGSRAGPPAEAGTVAGSPTTNGR